MTWLEQGNAWMKQWTENPHSLFQSWAAGKPTPGTGGGGADVLGNLNELMKRSLEGWATLAQQGLSGSAPMLFGADGLHKLVDPAQWSQAAASHFDLALERLTEGPKYATLWNLDQKVLNAQKLLAERSKDIDAYRAVVQQAWNRAFERFARAIADPKGAPIKSGRELLDLWIQISNETLLEMHRSEAFLETQRRMARSSADYRLQEREIAEAFCEAHHIPTRTEMDEVQREVIALRRELRALKRMSSAAPTAATARGSRAPAAPPETAKPRGKKS